MCYYCVSDLEPLQSPLAPRRRWPSGLPTLPAKRSSKTGQPGKQAWTSTPKTPWLSCCETRKGLEKPEPTSQSQFRSAGLLSPQLGMPPFGQNPPSCCAPSTTVSPVEHSWADSRGRKHWLSLSPETPRRPTACRADASMRITRGCCKAVDRPGIACKR